MRAGMAMLVQDAGGGGGSVVTWNPADKGTYVVLSGGNLTATNTQAGDQWETVRATLGKSSGKWYFEIVTTATGGKIDATFGIADSTVLLEGAGSSSAFGGFVGSGAAGASYGIYQRDGTKVTNSTFTSYGSGWGAGPVTIGVAVDLDNGKIWFAENNTYQASGDPAAGTNAAFTGLSGTFFPAVSHYNGNSYFSSTLKAAAADLIYTPPSGFSAWQT